MAGGADYFPDCLPDHLLERVGEVYSDPGYDGTFEGVKIEDGFPYLNGVCTLPLLSLEFLMSSFE